MSLITIPGIKFPIDCSSIEEHKRIPGSAKKMAMAGFVCCVNLTAADFAAAVSMEGVPEDIKATWLEMKPGPFIGIVSEFADTLTEGELMAILRHEEGHLVNGDLENPGDIEATDGFIDNQSYEIAADKYSVDAGSDPEDLHNAILKSIQAIGKFVESAGKGSGDELVKKMIAHESIIERFENLENLKGEVK